ncbi:putative reverse transcriptase domain-containing protein [Tanacetum coccineum]
MSSSTIHVSTDSSEDSVGSSASLIILSNSDSEATTLPTALPIDGEVEATDPPSADLAPVAPIIDHASLKNHSEPDFEPDFESKPFKDSFEGDVPDPYKATITRWRAHYIVSKRVHLFLARIPANHKRSHYVSSSSSSPSPYKRRRASPYSSSSASLSSSLISVGPSHKRCRSLAASVLIAALVCASLLAVAVDRLPPCNRLRGSPVVSLYKDTVKDTDKAPTEVASEPIPIQRLEEIEDEQIALKDRAKTTKPKRANLCGESALVAYEANSNMNIIKSGDENEDGNEGGNGNGNGSGNGNGHGDSNGNGNGGGNGNWNGNNDGNGNHNKNVGGAMQDACECIYKEFLNCQPLNFKGTERGVGLASNYEVVGEDMLKGMHFGAYTKKSENNCSDSLYAISNKEDTTNGIQKMESELRNLIANGNGVIAYTKMFQELSLLCPKMVYEEEDKIERSFMSTTFSSLIDIIPTALDVSYFVELANGRVVGSNSIIRGCMLKLPNHPFNIDLMAVELGSLDVIIGMDWLSKYDAMIIYDEKIVRI